MLGNPTVHEIVHGERGMLKGIQACIDALCLVCSITLIYSAIDALAALTIPIGTTKSKGSDFEAWVDQYLLPHLNASISAKDLWSARCGVLHAYSRHSDLSRSAKSRSLIYKWRTVHHPNDINLQEEIAAGAVVVEVESLVEAFRDATRSFQDKIDRDATLNQLVQHHVQRLLCYKPSMSVLLPRANSSVNVA